MAEIHTNASLSQGLDALQGKSVVIIGDIMLDKYLFGHVDRISPEAPVPIVAVASETTHLGGAGNVAMNVQRLGGDPQLFCASGDDETSRQLATKAAAMGIRVAFVHDPTRPTTTKTRVIAQHQQVLRIDNESTQALDKAVSDALLAKLAPSLPGAAVVILSDYGKGLVNDYFISQFNALLAGTSQTPRVLVDPKPANFQLFKQVYLLTPNAKEAAQCLGRLPSQARVDIVRTGRALMTACSCRNLLITLGPNGMALFEENGLITHIPTMAQKVFDVTGAGDTVIGTVGLALAAGLPLRTACLLANYAAGHVVGELGTAAVSPVELLQAIKRLPLPKLTDWTE